MSSTNRIDNSHKKLIHKDTVVFDSPGSFTFLIPCKLDKNSKCLVRETSISTLVCDSDSPILSIIKLKSVNYFHKKLHLRCLAGF